MSKPGFPADYTYMELLQFPVLSPEDAICEQVLILNSRSIHDRSYHLLIVPDWAHPEGWYRVQPQCQAVHLHGGLYMDILPGNLCLRIVPDSGLAVRLSGMNRQEMDIWGTREGSHG